MSETVATYVADRRPYPAKGARLRYKPTGQIGDFVREAHVNGKPYLLCTLSDKTYGAGYICYLATETDWEVLD
jgi:hypothetical protein